MSGVTGAQLQVELQKHMASANTASTADQQQQSSESNEAAEKKMNNHGDNMRTLSHQINGNSNIMSKKAASTVDLRNLWVPVQ